MTNEQKLAAALAKLGDTADEVAATLGLAGCKGKRGSTTDCPVAIYLGRVTDVAVLVDDDFIAAAGGGRVETPAPVADFICKFDELNFPDLIKE